METPDAPDADAEYFIRQVADRTQGRVRIAEGATHYPSADPDNELRLIRALESGKVKIAYLPSRAWERAHQGVLSFRALQAPFLVTDYALLRKVTTGGVAAGMLGSLERIGLVGLGLVPSQLRRPLGTHPLVSAAAFRGARIRVVTSPASALALRSLGATPVTNLDALGAADALAHHRLDGVESATRSISDNGYVSAAPYLPANVVLFAKAETIVIRRDVFQRLSRSDQAALRSAARATVRRANPGAEESEELAALCNHGLRMVTATPADLASLRGAGAAAYATLERDTATRHAIDAIQALRGGANAMPPMLPACTPRPKPAPAKTRFPQGRFTTTITADDFARANLPVSNGFPLPATAVTTLRGGRWTFVQTPKPATGAARLGGPYEVHGDQLTFMYDNPKELRGLRETVQWSYYRGQLTMKVIDVQDRVARLFYSVHAWRQLGH